MDNLAYLFAAYLIIWIGIFGYMLTLDSRQRALSQEIEMLKLALEERHTTRYTGGAGQETPLDR